MNSAQQVRKLVYNGIRYRLLKYIGRPHRLESISLEITHRCICRCSMCNIWQIPKQVPDLELFVWLELLSSPELRGPVVPLNTHDLEKIADYAETNDLFTIISPCIITPNRFGNSDREADLRFSPEGLDAIIRFYESPRFAWSGHREALLGYLKTGRNKKPCAAGINTLFVRYKGEVFSCPVLPISLGEYQRPAIGKHLPRLGCRSVSQKGRRLSGMQGVH